MKYISVVVKITWGIFFYFPHLFYFDNKAKLLINCPLLKGNSLEYSETRLATKSRTDDINK